jgi:hypothetical protein
MSECYREMFAVGRGLRDERALVGMLGLDATQAAVIEVHRDSIDWVAARMVDARRSTFLTSRVPSGEVAMALTRTVVARR